MHVTHVLQKRLVSGECFVAQSALELRNTGWLLLGSGLVTNSFLFCWIFTIKDRCKQVRFHFNESRFAPAVLDSVLGNLRLAWHTWLCPCFTVVLKATGGESRALEGQLKRPSRRRRGSCWEERKRIAFPWRGVINLPSRQINDFFYKKKRKRKRWVSGQQTWCWWVEEIGWASVVVGDLAVFSGEMSLLSMDCGLCLGFTSSLSFAACSFLSRSTVSWHWMRWLFGTKVSMLCLFEACILTVLGS